MKLLINYRQRNRWVILLWSALALVIITSGVFVITAKEVLPIAVETADLDDLREGDFISITSFIPLTDFAYEQADGIEYTYFLVALSDGYDRTFLAGWRVRPDDAQIIWERFEATDEPVWIIDLTYHGRLEALPEEALGYFDEGLEAVDYDGSLPVLRLVLHAKSGSYVADSNDNLLFGGILMLMGVLVGMYPIFVLSGLTQRQVWRTAQRLTLGGSAKEWLDDFAQSATNLNGTYINRDAILYDNDGITKLVPSNEVVWAYGHQQHHKLYFVITIKTTHQVILKTNDKRTHRIRCRSKDQANMIFEGLRSNLPQVILGYSASLEKLYQRNPSGFIASVNDISA